MPGTTGDEATQSDAGSQAQGADSTAQGAGTNDQGSSDQTTSDTATLQARIAALESDNYSYRERERQRQAQAPDKGGDGNDPKLAARVAELETQLEAQGQELTAERSLRQEQSLHLAAQSTATKLGYRNPELAARLIDPDVVERAADGSPKNLEKLLTDIAKAEPYLITSTDFGGGQRGSSAGAGSDMNAMIRRAAGRPG